MGRLTTHVLDTAGGWPAAGVRIRLVRCDQPGKILAETHTNADGRCPAPLLEGAALSAGEYQLEFDAGGYFGSETDFLGTVVLRFRVADPNQHYHVPLLLSPYGYTTYRGS
jgi:5-hydroxyisourate hydrolase